MIKSFDHKQFVRRKRDNINVYINVKKRILFDLFKRKKLRARNRIV